MCAAAQSAKDHIIGCRVTWKTPCGASAACAAARGSGRAGLRWKEPASRIEAMSMMAVARAHMASPAPFHSGVPPGPTARNARAAQTNVASATSD